LAGVIQALAKVSLTLKGSRYELVSRILRRKLALELLTPEEERLVACGFEYIRDVDGSADAITGIVVTEQRLR